MKKLLLLVVAAICTLSGLPASGQGKDSGTREQKGQAAADLSAKEARWSGIVEWTGKDRSTLTVRSLRTNQDKTIHYDDSTKWVSQEHGSKKVNDIDRTQVKNGDRVICVGWEDKAGFHAALVSKRLTPR